jgi:hypothetical protein
MFPCPTSQKFPLARSMNPLPFMWVPTATQEPTEPLPKRIPQNVAPPAPLAFRLFPVAVHLAAFNASPAT